MCGIAGIFEVEGRPVRNLEKKVRVMNMLQSHRGPDGDGIWSNASQSVGLGHRRLSIIDLNRRSNQPMKRGSLTVSFNGEIYNYQELREKYRHKYQFKTKSDTEVLLAGLQIRGRDFLEELKGMFSFAIWDEKNKYLLCARDRCGIKPLNFLREGDVLYIASEAKALLPFVKNIETDRAAFSDYLIFQYSLGSNTLFKNIHQLEPGHTLEMKNGNIKISRYWDVEYRIDRQTSTEGFHEAIEKTISDSVKYHLVSDVEVGSYVSGGIDSSLLFNLASEQLCKPIKGFHGRFLEPPGFDESEYAKAAIEHSNGELILTEMNSTDFLNNINDVIYHLDFPVAGPGSFPQYMVSKDASKHLKVLLGGQGGDEIFGGYARYVICYLEQCLKAAIDGTSKNGNFLVTLESIIPNLQILQEYKPLIKKAWRDGLFDAMDLRYLTLLDKSSEYHNEINWDYTELENTRSRYMNIFNNKNNVGEEAYFEKMTHFDFKTLLPALLHVEDRVSMAHGLESRVPFVDTDVIELLATVPADKKFPEGRMKFLLKEIYSKNIPEVIANRRDKMGFPVPLSFWLEEQLKDFLNDTFSTARKKYRDTFSDKAFENYNFKQESFSRKTWGLLSLELWYQNFHDRSAWFKKLID